MNQKQRIAYSLFAQSQLMIETLDELEGTKLSSKKERNLMRRVQDLNIGRINKIHESMSTKEELSLNDMVRAVKVTVLAIKNKEVDLYIGLMEALNNGEIKFEDSVKDFSKT